MGDSLIPSTVHGLLVLVGLALISHVAGQGLIAYAFAHLPAAVSSITLLAQPVLATLFAWLLLGERLTLMEAVGGATVLSGILIARHRIATAHRLARRQADRPVRQTAPAEGQRMAKSS